jgi:hypothetical protein
MPSLAVYVTLGLAAIVPRVEDPWPDTVGVDLPLTLAAAGAALGGVARSLAAREKQERAIKVGGLIGFCAGLALYFVALLVQVGSHI